MDKSRLLSQRSLGDGAQGCNVYIKKMYRLENHNDVTVRSREPGKFCLDYTVNRQLYIWVIVRTMGVPDVLPSGCGCPGCYGLKG